MMLKDFLRADWERLATLSQSSSNFSWIRCINPRFLPVVLIRLAFCLHRSGFFGLGKTCAALNLFLFGIEVPCQLNIGPGLVIPHTVGIVLGAASIGKNATIFHQVTLGATIADYAYDLTKRPTIGDNVTITVGAKVLGTITIGNGAVIGANAVVLKNVPINSLAVGVPAVIK
jgi:serine O-acetyltransferase